MRLDFYFPQKSESLVLKFLDSIDVSLKKRDGLNNNVQFIEAILSSKSEKIRQKIAEIMRTTQDLNLFLATLPVVDRSHDKGLVKRCKEFLTVIEEIKKNERARPDVIKKDVRIISQRASDLHEIIVVQCQEESAEFYKKFLKDAENGALRDFDNAMKNVEGPIAKKALAPLLKDKSVVKDGPSNPTRLCDFAAKLISEKEEELSFDFDSTEQNRDQQIGLIWKHCTGIGIRRSP